MVDAAQNFMAVMTALVLSQGISGFLMVLRNFPNNMVVVVASKFWLISGIQK